MDDLLSEFLTETSESLDVIDVELVKFEQDPNNADILANIFRLMHTIKGTCGFLGLPRLEALAHAAETLMGNYREGAAVTQNGVSLILQTIDRLKEILTELEANEAEPAGSDDNLIASLDQMSSGAASKGAAAPQPSPQPVAQSLPDNPAPPPPKEGEVSLDELEAAFLSAPGPDEMDTAPPCTAPVAMEQASETVAEPVDAPVAANADEGHAAAAKEGAVKNQSIRVNVETLEHLMTMVSELVLTRNQLLEMVRRLDESEFKVPLQRLSTVTAELQDGVMKTRMQPIGNAWQKLPRVVRDLAQELNKKIDLQMHGADTELDRQVLDLIKDPLTHMVRNSADHGLETSEGRVAAGKPEVGVVKLSAYHEGGHIIIEIADDGAGLNTDRIKEKIIQNGLAAQTELDQMTENQINRFIFKAGFSTAAAVTSVSGRGVGMDVVRSNIELIGGTVDVKSVRGAGSTFVIKIPLTLAIVSALIVESCGHKFAIPQLSVVELVRTNKTADHRIEMINETPVLRLRNKLLPLIKLSKLLDLEYTQVDPAAEADGASEQPLPEAEIAIGEAPVNVTTAGDENLFVVVIHVGAQLFGIVVDSVFDTEEIVVKPMSAMLRDIALFSGNTILGDGSVIMIVDPNGIAQSVAQTTTAETGAITQSAEEEVHTAEDKTAVLLFRAGSDEPKAVPLSLVTRLEEIEARDIERSNGQDLVQYRGVLMPLVYVDEEKQRKSEGQLPVLVFSDNERSMGLVVDEIVDIVEDRLNIEIKSDKPGLVGSAIIMEKATEIIDIAHYIEQAFDDWLEHREGTSISRGASLLLIDDSAFFRNMLAPLLSASGYKVTLADSAHKALELRDRGISFDVIVSDIEMPEMDGIAFAESVRGDPAWKHIPIIALSSHTAPHVIERSRRAGFTDFVGKFDRQGLMESIRDCNSDMEVAA